MRIPLARSLGLFVSVLALAATTNLSVQIKEYDVPTPNARPHDPAVGVDDSLWTTEQAANKLGELDPTTGKWREFPLKTPGSGPHGLVADRDGNIWFTAISKGYIGKLDTKTGNIAEYRPSSGQEIDPHTPVFDQHGMLWFTNEESSLIGRLDPRTGDMKLVATPTPHAVPYGIVITSQGTPIFCEFHTNKLASVDPQSMTIREYALPETGARPRRLAVAPDGTIYFSDFAQGKLGHFDPATGKAEEWPSPGGANSEPYGIAVTSDGMVWYMETGVKPNMLIRFDPKTKAFAAAKIPSGGGVVRNMAVAKDGKLYLACSGVNKVAIVTP